MLGTAPVAGADVSASQASLTVTLAGAGTQTVHASYSGDATYFPSASDYVFTTVAPRAAAPAVTRISPARGTHLGGTLVAITGRNFTDVTAIRIGGVLMRSVHCSSSTSCTAVTPRGTGTKAIRVTTAAGTSAPVAADRFTYR